MYGTFLWFIFLFSFSYSECSFVTQIVISGIRIVMHQPIPAAPSLTPPPPRATAGHLPALSVSGVGRLQILRCPGAGYLPTPSFWHARGFLPEYNCTKDFTGKTKGIGSFVKDRKQLKRFVKACSRFYACMSSLHIKPELQGNGAIDVNQRLLNQISVEYFKNILPYF